MSGIYDELSSHSSLRTTPLLFSANYDFPFFTATVDDDYTTDYSYASQASIELWDNGAVVAYGTVPPNQGVWAHVTVEAPANAGDYYEAIANSSLVSYYVMSQTTNSCGGQCSDYYDPFGYSDVLDNPEGDDWGPVFSTIVYAPIIIRAVVTGLAPQIQLGKTGAGTRLAGPTNTFDLKFRAFIQPAWLTGPDPCYNNGYYGGGTIYGGDNRGYDPFSMNFRAASHVVVSSNTGTWTQTPTYTAGITHRYGDDALEPDGYSLYTDSVLHDCHYTDDVFQEDNSEMFGSVSGGGIGYSQSLRFGQRSNQRPLHDDTGIGLQRHLHPQLWQSELPGLRL